MWPGTLVDSIGKRNTLLDMENELEKQVQLVLIWLTADETTNLAKSKLEFHQAVDKVRIMIKTIADRLKILNTAIRVYESGEHTNIVTRSELPPNTEEVTEKTKMVVIEEKTISHETNYRAYISMITTIHSLDSLTGALVDTAKMLQQMVAQNKAAKEQYLGHVKCLWATAKELDALLHSEEKEMERERK